MSNDWFIKDDKNIQIEEIEDVDSLKETEDNPIFTHDRIILVSKYTVENQQVIKTEITVKYEAYNKQ